jgi:HK97 family phage portal protein
MNLWSRLVTRPAEERAGVVELFPTWAASTERAYGSLRDAYRINSTVHAAVNARQRVFSEVTFALRRRSSGDLVHNHPALSVLEKPWSGGTSTELLKRMELDASLSGNAFVLRAERNLLQVLDPTKVEIVHDGRQKTGYRYWPNGIGQGDPRGLLLEEVAHWAPIPHPDKQFLGASWVEVVATEIRTDLKMVGHQEKFFDNAATPNLFVKVEGSMRPEAKDRLRQELERRYAGVANAWKTMVMDGGADLSVVGANFEQMDYVNTLKSTEARIASAAGVPPIIIALKAGLDASTYSNYGMAMRAFADHLIRPNWNSVVAALSQIITEPQGTDLWYDDRHVSALRQDKEVEAKVLSTKSAAIRQLIDGGFDADAVVEAIESNELDRLKGRHSGNLSVQLQPADPDQQEDSEPPPADNPGDEDDE